MAPTRAGALPGGLPYFALGDGPPLVVCSGLTPAHENPKGAALWLERMTLRPFARHRTVYAVNRKPGLATGATMADIAADYASAIDAEFGEPLDVIGISTGGSVALQLAIDHPHLVRTLVLASSACRLSDRGRAVQRRVAERALAGDERGEYRELWRALAHRPAAQAALGGVAWALGPLVFGRRDDPSDMVITIDAEDAFDATHDLARVTAPTLVVGGGRDGFYSPEIFRRTANGIPGGRLLLQDRKGHIGALGKRFVRDTLELLGHH